MATTLTVLVNYVDSTVKRVTTPADYIEISTTNDYLIWSATLADLMTHEPTSAERNAAATVISDSAAVTVAKCLLMDYSHSVGGSIYTHLVKGMSEDKQYVFCFSFDNITATEPQLEAWDTNAHTTFNNNVLGAGVALSSMVKAVCTTNALPGGSWAGTAIAGSSNVVLLNDGAGALLLAKDLYSNIKITIPIAFASPSVETFVLTTRFTYF